MEILKIINNNIVSATDEDGNEVVAMGRGLGFKRKPGQDIAETEIEKIFRIDNQDSMERFKKLLKGLPMEYVQLADEIISCAKENLDIMLSETVYLTLTDHISFVIDQCKAGRSFTNILHEEVKRFYSDEYTVGLKAVEMIRERTGCALDADEAASIALHLVNAEFDMSVKDTWVMTNMIQDMLSMIEQELQIENQDSLYKGWLSINLKFLAHRMLKLPPDQAGPNPELAEFSKSHYSREYQLADKVNQYVVEKYECRMTEEEKLYLVLHIGRIKEMSLR